MARRSSGPTGQAGAAGPAEARPKKAAERNLRGDAARNRELIIGAAREVLCERGLQAPLEEVAQRAGVGIATLYRRFPTRADLITTVFDDKMSDYVAAVDAALAHDDPWLGFCEYVRRVCAMQAADAGFADVLSRTFPTGPEFEQRWKEAHRKFTRLIRRAQQAGRLRSDFVSQDLVLFLMANAGVVSATRDAAPDAWERFAAYVLEAVRAPGAAVLPPPPRPSQLLRVIEPAR